MLFALTPQLNRVRAKLGRARALERVAVSVEEVSPAETAMTQPTVILDSELAKVTAVQEGTTLEHEMRRIRGHEAFHEATLRYEVEDAFVWPGGFAVQGLTPVSIGLPPLSSVRASARRFERGCFVQPHVGLRYFGHWVRDGLPKTVLVREGEALLLPTPHNWWSAKPLLALAGIEPDWTEGYARVERLSFFRDLGQNAGKRARLARLRDRLQSAVPKAETQSVYLRRGRGGEARGLANEEELTRALEARGFAIVSTEDPIETVLAACNGAQRVVSIEGSHTAPGMLGIAKGGTLLAISPADRFNNVYSDVATAVGFTYACAVAERAGAGHVADVGAVLATLDLAEEQAGRA